MHSLFQCKRNAGSIFYLSVLAWIMWSVTSGITLSSRLFWPFILLFAFQPCFQNAAAGLCLVLQWDLGQFEVEITKQRLTYFNKGVLNYQPALSKPLAWRTFAPNTVFHIQNRSTKPKQNICRAQSGFYSAGEVTWNPQSFSTNLFHCEDVQGVHSDISL